MSLRSEEALIALRQIFLAVEIDSRALAKQSNLNPSQFILLQLLNSKKFMTPGEIAKNMSLAHATVSTLTEKLRKTGLVRRETCTADKRSQTISLTELGRETLFNAPDILQRRFEKQFENVREEEQEQIVFVLKQLSSILGADDIDAAPLLDVGSATSIAQ